ncbi:hypothetical protein EVAR_33828_1 [Eumeta japonica]|uniref:Uncharacterized protein n=1 Tax=Eumeta variegata TaxID=151549 RepID=A0A4C1VDD0_EUMVA|nr:hypothetical protein EVAR_33828_1 [Eumeta japonica]
MAQRGIVRFPSASLGTFQLEVIRQLPRSGSMAVHVHLASLALAYRKSEGGREKVDTNGKIIEKSLPRTLRLQRLEEGKRRVHFIYSSCRKYSRQHCTKF